MGADDARRLPFTVIGGYLGAGKTTLLNALLADAGGRRIAVLVNDFGSLAVDASLVRRHDGETIELASGCMCCSLAGGFGEAITRVLDRAADFDHVVIEASGVAEPDRVVGWGLTHGLVRDATLVVADAECVRERADDRFVGDVVRRQLRSADLVVLNKTDLVSDAALADVRAWIERTAPGARVLETQRARVPTDVVLGPLRPGRRDGDPGAAVGGRSSRLPGEAPAPDGHAHDEHHGDHPDEHPRDHAAIFETWTLVRPGPVPRSSIERLASHLGESSHRAKGFVHLAEAPTERLLFQQVGRRWTLEPPGEPLAGTPNPSDRRHPAVVDSARAPGAPGAPALAIVVIGPRGSTDAASLALLLDEVRPSST